MALFGDVGKFFSSGVGAAILPVVPITQAAYNVARGNPKAAQQTVAATPFARAAIGLTQLGAKNRRVDAPQGAPGQQQMETQFAPQSYFQPAQFSGGSYDPNLGGGAPDFFGGSSWDSLTGFPATQGTPSWETYSAGMEDWAANW